MPQANIAAVTGNDLVQLHRYHKCLLVVSHAPDEAVLEVVLKPYEKLQRYWRDTKAGISTVQLNPESVADLEKRYDIWLPDYFRDYLLQSCPEGSSAYDYETT